MTQSQSNSWLKGEFSFRTLSIENTLLLKMLKLTLTDSLVLAQISRVTGCISKNKMTFKYD